MCLCIKRSCCLCVGIRAEIREVEEGVYGKESNVLKVGWLLTDPVECCWH